MTLATGAHNLIDNSTPTLTEVGAHCKPTSAGVVCDSLFDGSQPLYPGAPPITRTVTLTYQGSQKAGVGGLYIGSFVSRSATSAPLCTAADPAAGFELSVAADGQSLYQGSLSDFAAAHSDASNLLPLRSSWRSGESVAVTLAVTMPRSAGNEFMGCVSAADFIWTAE
jgi:hypothetical protein